MGSKRVKWNRFGHFSNPNTLIIREKLRAKKQKRRIIKFCLLAFFAFVFDTKLLQRHIKAKHKIHVEVQVLHDPALRKLRELRIISPVCTDCAQRIGKRKDKRDQKKKKHTTICQERILQGRALRDLYKNVSKAAQNALLSEIDQSFDLSTFRKLHQFWRKCASTIDFDP